MSSNVEQIKERLGIVEVVGSYVKLEKAGSNYKAKCPFHNEKTPSFFVSPSRGSYYCFGCNAKGDIFSFVEQFEGLDFVGALKVLAARAGVELVRENPQAKSEKDRLYRVLDVATEFFEKSLATDTEAKEYLAKRGVKEATITDWRLGFAPDSWRALHDELTKRGFSTAEMYAAGLVKKTDKPARTTDGVQSGGGNYDVFRGRIMFPIFDSSERVIGFSGRLLPRLDDGKMGKYINSPETVLFNKSRVLYGLHKAKFDIRKRDYSIVVEGQMDLIMSHQAGFTNTVAVSGTALTGKEILKSTVPSNFAKQEGITETRGVSEIVDAMGMLKRFSDNVIFAFDSDEAGFKAAQRATMTALKLGMDVKMAKIKGGKDAADLILENPVKWAEIIKNSKHIIDFSLETLLEKKLEPRKLGREIVGVVLPYVKTLPSAVDQAHFITKISSKAGIKEDALWAEFKKVVAPEPEPALAASAGSGPRPNVSRKNTIEKKILGILYWQEAQTEGSTFDAKAVRKNLEEILGAKRLPELEAANQKQKGELIFEAELSYDATSNLEGTLQELLLNLEEEILNEKLVLAMNSEAKTMNLDLITKLTKRKQELKDKRQGNVKFA